MERRRYRRQEINGKARICWPGKSGHEAVTFGTIRNVSARGALLQAKMLPPLGTKVSLELQLRNRQKTAVKLEATGVVNRVEKYGIAVETSIMRIRKSGGPRKIRER